MTSLHLDAISLSELEYEIVAITLVSDLSVGCFGGQVLSRSLYPLADAVAALVDEGTTDTLRTPLLKLVLRSHIDVEVRLAGLAESAPLVGLISYLALRMAETAARGLASADEAFIEEGVAPFCQSYFALLYRPSSAPLALRRAAESLARALHGVAEASGRELGGLASILFTLWRTGLLPRDLSSGFDVSALLSPRALGGDGVATPRFIATPAKASPTGRHGFDSPLSDGLAFSRPLPTASNETASNGADLAPEGETRAWLDLVSELKAHRDLGRQMTADTLALLRALRPPTHAAHGEAGVERGFECAAALRPSRSRGWVVACLQGAGRGARARLSRGVVTAQRARRLCG